MRVTLAAIFVLGFCGAAAPQPLFLIVGASDASPAAIARKAKTASRGQSPGLVFDARDCGDKKVVFGWAAEIAESEDAAQNALAHARASIPGAYLKRCKVRAGSLLALRQAAIDPSIADVPDDVVNWSDSDRVSSAAPLKDGRVVVTVRYYRADPNDDMEGRRQRLVLVNPDGKSTTLIDSCPGSGAVRERAGMIAFQCATESAADQDLHSTLVFDASGRKLTEVTRCGNPSWVSDQKLKCSEESIGADGVLSLRPKQIRLP